MPTQTSSTIRSAAQVRSEFIDFFVRRHSHTFVPSSPTLPHNDPTLLFTNAGMNQFKDIFLGRTSAQWTRAVNSQKCIRAGGKHNDLEDVGKDTYHHTFFEMLGNWSFGDYFKAEAIEWAWQLLTDIWRIDPERLHATYFQGDPTENLDTDTEARDLWLRYLPSDHVHPGNKKDNFWEMGDTGPCGPCSEIHFDQTPDGNGGGLVNKSDPRVIEIWNLVFIQFNRNPGGTLSPLPARHVDTGMGFERILRVLQNKTSNYDTDLWKPIFAAIQQHTGARAYRGSLEDHTDIAYRVIADHIRCITVALTDGARPSNEGRGYVLRRILRRAVRHGHQTLQTKGAWLHKLVPSLVQSLGEAFPELKSSPQQVAHIILEEEEAFLRTLDRGIELFNEAALRATTCRDRQAQVLFAADAFKLHDTYGFPIDLTRVMAAERGMTVDEAGYEQLMEEARQRSRAGGGDREHIITLSPQAIAQLKYKNVEPTADLDKYHGRPITATVAAIYNGNDFDDEAHDGRRLAVILDRTNCYAESGGQIGDAGEITRGDEDFGTTPARGLSPREGRPNARFRVEDTQSVGGYVLHIGRMIEHRLRVGDRVEVIIDRAHRTPIRANHTATHLLNLALRGILADETVDQKGSLVAPNRLRFDFSSGRALNDNDLHMVQTLVNSKIELNLEVFAKVIPLKQAMSIRGLRAVFGEKYPDPVRVVSVGVPIEQLITSPDNDQWLHYSIELCGGTHLANTGEANRFLITQETALSAGIRRIVAITGPQAMAADRAAIDLDARVDHALQLEGQTLVEAVADFSRLVDELTLGVIARNRIKAKLEPLRDKVKSLQKLASGASRDAVVKQARTIADNAAGLVIVHTIDGADKDTILSALDVVRASHHNAAIMLLSPDHQNTKVFIAASVAKNLITKGLKAGDWVKIAAQACGGGGGGRPDMAQAGGKDPDKILDALNAAQSHATTLLA